MTAAIINVGHVAELMDHAATRTALGAMRADEHYSIGVQLKKAERRLAETHESLLALTGPSAEAAQGARLIGEVLGAGTDGATLGAVRSAFDDATRGRWNLLHPLRARTRDAIAATDPLVGVTRKLDEAHRLLTAAPDVEQLADIGRRMAATASKEADAALPAHVFAPDAKLDKLASFGKAKAFARVNAIWHGIQKFLNVHVHGAANVPREGAFLLVAGPHNSYLDPSAVMGGLERPIRMVAAGEITGIPLVGAWMVKRMGAITIKRGGGGGDEMIGVGSRSLAKGQPLGIFAAGGLSRMRARGLDVPAVVEDHGAGAARFALQGYEVVTAGIYGAGPKYLRSPAPGHGVHVNYAKPLYFGRIDEPTRLQTAAVREAIREAVYDATSEAMKLRAGSRWRDLPSVDRLASRLGVPSRPPRDAGVGSGGGVGVG